MSTTLPEDDQSPGESAAAVPAGSGVGPSYEDFFSYHLALLVKLTERTTAERFHASAGLTLSEGRAITILGAHQPIRVQDIAERSSLDKSQASRVAVSLQERGLVTKHGSDSDRRASSISLTAEGWAVHHSLLALAQQRNHEILAPLTLAQRRRLLRDIDTLILAAQQADRPARRDGQSATE